MPITCECPQCGKRLKAADSAAGKKAKSPDCGGAVPIPALKPRKKPPDDDDEFDLQKLNVDAGMEGPIEEDQMPCPMCGEMIKAAAVKCRYCGEDLGAPKGKRKGKRNRSSGGGGMPVSVIVAVIVEVLFVVLNVVGIFGNLSQSNVAGAVGSVARILLEIAVLAGLFSRKGVARILAMVLSGIGIFFMFVCGGFVLFLGQMPQVQAQFPDQVKVIVIAVLVLQIVLYIIQMVTLMSGSAQDFLDQ